MASSKALIWTTVGAVVLGGGFIGYFGLRMAMRETFGDVVRLQAELPKELEAAQKEGLPITPEQLFPDRPLSESENAAKVVAQNSASIDKATGERDIFEEPRVGATVN